MKKFALGWACNLNDLFVRFPYEKCKILSKKFRTKVQRRQKVKQVFTTGVEIILNDIIENNTTFELPPLGYYKGEIHFEPITGEEFKRVRSKGKFSGIDFLETLFTGYQLYLYIHGKRDNFLHRRKIPIYMSRYYRNKLEIAIFQKYDRLKRKYIEGRTMIKPEEYALRREKILEKLPILYINMFMILKKQLTKHMKKCLKMIEKRSQLQSIKVYQTN